MALITIVNKMDIKPPHIDVFISRKSADAFLAKELYDYLISKGLYVFDSDETLPKLGNSDYRKEIDKALENCRHMVVVGSSVENISSSWVEAEWGFYISEKRAGRKSGNILTVVKNNLQINTLPASLRYYEVIPFNKINFERIAAYLGRDFNEQFINPSTHIATEFTPRVKQEKKQYIQLTIPDPIQKLKEAKNTNRTDFGSLGHSRSNGADDKTLETEFGKYVLHGNGTFTDVSNHLMWIQAPWGMIWDGEFFIGEPVSVNWNEATKMFGKGVFMQRNNEDSANFGDGVLPPALMEKTSIRNGYKQGNCKINFAGFSDWRLPTCEDYYKTILQDMIKSENEKERRHLNEQLWGDRLPSNQFWNSFFWTANGRVYGDFMEKLGFDQRVAWKAEPEIGLISDDRKELGYKILFVRHV